MGNPTRDEVEMDIAYLEGLRDAGRDLTEAECEELERLYAALDALVD